MRASTYLCLLAGGVLLTLSVSAAAENAVTNDPASVYAGPDGSYPQVAQIDAATPVQVMGCLDDWSWCDITFGGNRGWLYSPDLTYEYQGGYVPFYSYAPAFGIPVVAFSLDAYWGSYYHDRPWYGQRDQWVHRTIQHRRPSGPAPSRSLPPRQVVSAERPHGGSQPAQPLRVGSAQPSRQDAERHDGSAGRAADSRAPAARPQEHSPPPAHVPPQEHAPAQSQPADRNSTPPERAAPQRVETPHRDDRRPAPEKAPNPQPPKDEQGDHPK